MINLAFRGQSHDWFSAKKGGAKRWAKVTSQCLNLNSSLVKRQIDNPSPGAVAGGNQSLALTREVNLDTLSSDSSEEEIRDSGRSFQSLIVWGKKCSEIKC